jgi:hypothetical protein
MQQSIFLQLKVITFLHSKIDITHTKRKEGNNMKKIDALWRDYKLTNILNFVQSNQVTPKLKNEYIVNLISNCNVDNDIVTWEDIDFYLKTNPISEINVSERFGVHLSTNPYTTWEHVRRYPHFCWSYRQLCCHANITWSDIYHNPVLWLPEASMNPNVTKEIVDRYPDFPWSEKYLCQNVNFTHEMLYSCFPTIQRTHLLMNAYTSWEMINAYSMDDWEFGLFSDHNAVTWDVMKNNVELPWNFGMIAFHNKNITWKHIQKYPFIFGEHRFVFLVSNPNSMFDLIHKYLTCPGNKSTLFVMLLRNQFTLEKALFYKQHQSFQQVLRQLHEYYYHPYHIDRHRFTHGHHL